MNSITNAPINDSRAQFDTLVLDVDSELADKPISPSISLYPGQFAVLNRPPSVPEYFLGSFVALVCSGVCVQVGLVTEVFEGSYPPKFVVRLQPLIEAVQLRTRMVARTNGFNNNPVRYLFESTMDKQRLVGKVRRLIQVDADHLRAQIGAVVPEEILNVFWSDAERRAIQDDEAAQARYVDLVTVLIERI